jgi:hypothetical protein
MLVFCSCTQTPYTFILCPQHQTATFALCLQSVLCLCGQCLFAFLFVSFILLISGYVLSHMERSICLSCIRYNSDNIFAYRWYLSCNMKKRYGREISQNTAEQQYIKYVSNGQKRTTSSMEIHKRQNERNIQTVDMEFFKYV